MIYCILAAVILAVCIIKIRFDEIVYKKNLKQRLIMQWGQALSEEYSAEKMASIRAYYESSIQKTDVDDITWNDLEMDTVFQQINHTQSSIGQEYLYFLLRKPQFDAQSLKEREDLIRYFGEQEEVRLSTQLLLAELGKLGKFSVYEYLRNVQNLTEKSSVFSILQLILMIVCIGGCFFSPDFFVIPAVCVAIFNMVTYYARKGDMDRYKQLFSYMIRTARFAREFYALVQSTKDNAVLQPYADSLLTKIKRFDTFCKGSFLVVGGGKMTGDMTDILGDYIRMLSHVDIIKYRSMAKEALQLQPDLLEMFEIIGLLDSMISVASYRELKQDYCTPVLLQDQEKQVLSAQNLYHPLISSPVKNSISIEKSVLLTGSNASGKSTFIKTVAINAILAQTLHTVLADSYQTNYYQIVSSMALRDDILHQESYYIVEIRSLKRIVDLAVSGSHPVLCFIDEVLRGTNTLERIASSSQILGLLARKKALCFAATHDIELAQILENCYDNYHFEETIREDDVLFDYKLRKGTAMTRNAIKLLRMIGYQPQIVQNAEQSVDDFLTTGEWRKL